MLDICFLTQRDNKEMRRKTYNSLQIRYINIEKSTSLCTIMVVHAEVPVCCTVGKVKRRSRPPTRTPFDEREGGRPSGRGRGRSKDVSNGKWPYVLAHLRNSPHRRNVLGVFVRIARGRLSSPDRRADLKEAFILSPLSLPSTPEAGRQDGGRAAAHLEETYIARFLHKRSKYLQEGRRRRGGGGRSPCIWQSGRGTRPLYDLAHPSSSSAPPHGICYFETVFAFNVGAAAGTSLPRCPRRAAPPLFGLSNSRFSRSPTAHGGRRLFYHHGTGKVVGLFYGQGRSYH